MTHRPLRHENLRAGANPFADNLEDAIKVEPPIPGEIPTGVSLLQGAAGRRGDDVNCGGSRSKKAPPNGAEFVTVDPGPDYYDD
jgi:hypothetical protein